MISEDHVNEYLRTLLESSLSDRQAAANAIKSSVKGDELLHLSVRFAEILRDRGSMDEAEAVVAPFLHEPLLRARLLTELAYGFSIKGQPERAVSYLSAGANEGLLTNDWLLFAARQFARVRDLATAEVMLQRALRENPDLEFAVDVQRQFFQFVSLYDKPAAERLLVSVEERFGSKSLQELEDEILSALENCSPYLLLRLGDGEGSCIHISDEDESRYHNYYRSNRAEFAAIWFNDTTVLDDPNFKGALKDFNDVIGNADCLAGIYRTAVDHEYRLGSHRGIAWVVNTMRKATALSDSDPGWAKRTSLWSLTVHYDLLVSGALARLLAGRRFVGLISCHDQLPAALMRTYGITEVEFHKVPGEQVHADTLGLEAVAGKHWPDRYNELCRILDEPVDRRGQLFLVAAGMLGKIYAGKLKKSGAVVLDIGAVADVWMGKKTRVFPDLSAAVRLMNVEEPLVLVDVGGLGGLGEEWEPYLEEIKPIVFEPNPPEAERIRSTIARSQGGIVIERALSNWPERRKLYVAASLGCTSLLRPNQKVLSSYSIAPAFRTTHEVEVDCVRFDSLVYSGEIPVPDAVKIDVQGFEYSVLEGFGELLSKCLGIKLEAHLYPIYEGQKLLPDLVAFLESRGLSLRKMVPVDHFDGDLVEVDAWFTTSISRVGELDSVRQKKLSLIERVWNLPPRRAVFHADQFS